MAFVDSEKPFDGIPRQVILLALRKIGVDEWIVCETCSEIVHTPMHVAISVWLMTSVIS